MFWASHPINSKWVKKNYFHVGASSALLNVYFTSWQIRGGLLRKVNFFFSKINKYTTRRRRFTGRVMQFGEILGRKNQHTLELFVARKQR
jgi:hypothetical protein